MQNFGAFLILVGTAVAAFSAYQWVVIFARVVNHHAIAIFTMPTLLGTTAVAMGGLALIALGLICWHLKSKL